MKRYVIERNIPGVGGLDGRQLQEASATSCGALAQLGGRAQWVRSFVVADKTYCEYLADSEEAIREHSRLSGFPADSIHEVRSIIDPTTAAT